MRWMSFRTANGDSYGYVDGTEVVDIGAVHGASLPDLKSAFGQLDMLATTANAPRHALSQVRYLPVVPNPDKIFCIGINYATHLRETGRPAPQHPVIFTRFANSQIGAQEDMLRPKESIEFDFEGELAVVIGKAGRRIAAVDALDYVAGYACYNDGSIRDWQRHTSQFAPGKNFRGTGAFGPWLVTTDDIPDPAQLTLETRLNGQVMQSAPISDLIFGVADLIAYCSTFTDLAPGDVIITGTTGGVGAFREPQVWMKPGDTVEVEISSIGVLRNGIADDNH